MLEKIQFCHAKRLLYLSKQVGYKAEYEAHATHATHATHEIHEMPAHEIPLLIPTSMPQLIAVSKKFDHLAVQAAYAAGQTQFGENYVQEAVQKIHALQQQFPAIASQLTWHFIGHCQSNKLKEIVPYFHWVHTIDSLEKAQKLQAALLKFNQRSPHLPAKHIHICLQINIDDSPTKHGIKVNQNTLEMLHALDVAHPLGLKKPLNQAHLAHLAHSAQNVHTCLEMLSDVVMQIQRTCPLLTLRGLMVMPDAFDISNLAPAYTFQATHALMHYLNVYAINIQNPPMDTLSMGMSQDLEAAIMHGSTMVRVGTAIFGARPNDEMV